MTERDVHKFHLKDTSSFVSPRRSLGCERVSLSCDINHMNLGSSLSS